MGKLCFSRAYVFNKKYQTKKAKEYIDFRSLRLSRSQAKGITVGKSIASSREIREAKSDQLETRDVYVIGIEKRKTFKSRGIKLGTVPKDIRNRFDSVLVELRDTLVRHVLFTPPSRSLARKKNPHARNMTKCHDVHLRRVRASFIRVKWDAFLT